MSDTTKVLFVCTANKLRSPTAEAVFRGHPGIETLSAGIDKASNNPLTEEIVSSVGLIFAMETHHREHIRKKYKQRPHDRNIVTLHIPDEYERDDPALIELLKKKAGPIIRQFVKAKRYS